jgi:hypothetical protein
MNKFVLLAALLLSGALGAYAQTKGTNSLGLGLDFGNSETKINNDYQSNKSSSIDLNYARFIKDNVKLGLGVSYGFGESGSSQETKSFGISALYQRYYPVYKKLYVFIGGDASYNNSKLTQQGYSILNNNVQRGNYYSAGVYGGASYFLGKHWELEARLLNATFGYAKNRTEEGDYYYEQKGFSLRTAGSFTNLGFNINFLF